MPVRTPPATRSAAAASAPASTASRSPRSSISSRTPSANPSGNSAVSAQSTLMRPLTSQTTDAVFARLTEVNHLWAVAASIFFWRACTPTDSRRGGSPIETSATCRDLARSRRQTRYPDPPAAHRNHRVGQLGGGVIEQNLRHQGDPRGRRHIRESDEASVRSAPNVKQSSEVRTDCHQDPAAVGRPAKQGEVAGIRAERPRLDDVVALSPKPLGEAPPGASVDQELHGVETRTPSILSWAMTARAYSRQARMSSGSRSG